MFSSLDTATPDIDITLISPPKTFNIEDLDVETEEEEGEVEGKMTTKEAQKIIMKHSLPKATSRKMFNSQDMFLREGCLGLSPLEEKASPKQHIDIQE